VHVLEAIGASGKTDDMHRQGQPCPMMMGWWWIAERFFCCVWILELNFNPCHIKENFDI